MKIKIGVLLVATIVVLGQAFALAQEGSDQAQSNRPPPGRTCVSFDGHVGVVEIINDAIGESSMVINGITFRSKIQSDFLMLWGRGVGDSFLVFSHSGAEIILPRPAASVTIELFQGAQPYTLQALDSNGNVLDTREMDYHGPTGPPKEIMHITSGEFSISRIDLLGGSGEGGVIFICALMAG